MWDVELGAPAEASFALCRLAQTGGLAAVTLTLLKLRGD